MADQVDPTDAFALATPAQLLDYILLLGVPQRQLARQLGVTTSTVSMWVTHTRPIPVSYRPGLLQWAGVAYQHAQATNQKEVDALETPELKIAHIEAFMAPLHRWYLGVLHEAGVVRSRALKNARWLVELLEHDPLTTRDVEQIVGLGAVLSHQIAIIEEMGGAPEADPPPASEV
jgi:hypothetical protein